jgi:hypothetical protein
MFLYLIPLILIFIIFLVKKYFTDIKIIYYYIKVKYFNKGIEIPDSYIINNKVLKVYYKCNGNLYNIYIPYKKLRFDTNKYYLIKTESGIIDLDNNKVDNEINITQQKGIPFYVSADLLDGDKIICKNMDDTVKEYNKDEIPNIINK